MARAVDVRVGQVWNDAAGRPLEVLVAEGGQFRLRNLDTGRDLIRGPRALVNLVRDAAPGAPTGELEEPLRCPQCGVEVELDETETTAACNQCRLSFTVGNGAVGVGPQGYAPPVPPYTPPPSQPPRTLPRASRGAPGVLPCFVCKTPTHYVTPGPNGVPVCCARCADVVKQGQQRAPLQYHGPQYAPTALPPAPPNYQAPPAPPPPRAPLVDFSTAPAPGKGAYPSTLTQFIALRLSRMAPEQASVPDLVSREVAHALASWKMQHRR